MPLQLPICPEIFATIFTREHFLTVLLHKKCNKNNKNNKKMLREREINIFMKTICK